MKRNKLITAKGNTYLVMGVKKILDRLFGKVTPQEVSFSVEKEDIEEKTITIKMYKNDD